MATSVTITTNGESSNYTLTTGGRGPQGDPGEGVPAGGTTGQVLVKASGADHDTVWDDVAGGAVAAGADPNSGGKSEMTISGASIPGGVATVLQQLDDPIWGKSWSSNGDTIANNHGVVAYTSIRFIGAAWFVLAFDASGSGLYSDSDGTYVPDTGWPDDGVYNGYSTTVTATGETLTATHLGQWCKASTAWWQWSGTAWIPRFLLNGRPITRNSADTAYFSLGVDGIGLPTTTPFP